MGFFLYFFRENHSSYYERITQIGVKNYGNIIQDFTYGIHVWKNWTE